MTRLLFALFVSVCSQLVLAETPVAIKDAWVREAPPSAHMLAAYMTLQNTTGEEQVLVGVSSPHFSHVMLHKSEVVDGVARMIHLDEIVIPGNSSVELAPGGLHLMMPAPEDQLTEGDSVEFVLTFSNGDPVTVEAEVRKKP